MNGYHHHQLAASPSFYSSTCSLWRHVTQVFIGQMLVSLNRQCQSTERNLTQVTHSNIVSSSTAEPLQLESPNLT